MTYNKHSSFVITGLYQYFVQWVT